MKEEKFPARLHVLIARDSEKALVIRRGPSKSTCIFSWNRKENIFKVSQWIKGRIYERRSDISPSGVYWIYFAMNGKWNSKAKGSWTAISKAPWLKAISLYAKGDCWHGGGLFLDEKSYWLNDGYGHEELFTSNEVEKSSVYKPEQKYGGECLGVYYHRLQRDGWNMMGHFEKARFNSETIFEKKLPEKWLLRKVCHEQVNSPEGKGCYWDEHEIVNEREKIIFQPDWEWADWIDGAIVYADKGCLYRIAIESSDKLSEAKLLHDFNDYKFESRQAPY